MKDGKLSSRDVEALNRAKEVLVGWQEWAFEHDKERTKKYALATHGYLAIEKFIERVDD